MDPALEVPVSGQYTACDEFALLYGLGHLVHERAAVTDTRCTTVTYYVEPGMRTKTKIKENVMKISNVNRSRRMLAIVLKRRVAGCKRVQGRIQGSL